MTNSIIRSVDELGRIAIPKSLRSDMHISEGDPMEIYFHNGEIIIRKYHKSFEQCATEWYYEHRDLMYMCEFIDHDDYTFCIVPPRLTPTGQSHAGYAKRHKDDTNNGLVASVASYANAMGKNVNKMIGYKD